MNGVFRKHSEVGKRIKDIEKSMSAIDAEIRSLSRELSREEKNPGGKARERTDVDGGASVRSASEGSGAASSGRERERMFRGYNAETERDSGGHANVRERSGSPGSSVPDKKLITYLASKDFQPSRPLKHQRRIQRNRAIIMLLIVGVLLVWLIGKAFLS